MIPNWIKNFQPSTVFPDIIAGLVVGVLVVPQSLGYAVLAGLPPEYGLYAAIVPVLVYAWADASNVQAVGPVAITAIMTASGLAEYADQGAEIYASMASLLALMVGAILWLAGKLKLGWIMQFISRGVASGFVSGAAVLIFISQIKYYTGINFSGNNLFQSLSNLFGNFSQFHQLTTLLGTIGFLLLLLNRYANRWVWQSWLPKVPAKWLERMFPLFLVIIFIVASSYFNFARSGVRIIGEIPTGLPHFVLPTLPATSAIIHLLPTAGLMALIAFVSSSAVTSFYARQRGESFNADAELKALGLSNFFGGFFQSFAVAGGFSRTAINVDSGAKTPFAGVITTCVMIAALLFLGDIISPLPYALLGATIMASIIGLMDIKTFRHACKVDRLDAISLAVTFLSVLVFGLNTGLIIGLLMSFAGLIWQYSNPHIAIVGVLKGTEHFRNISRHNVQTFDNLLIMRIDEGLFFGNSESVQTLVHTAIQEFPNAKEIILMMSAVNHIDLTAQEMLVELNNEIKLQEKRLHFTEVKGPVMDIIEHTEVINKLSGEVYISTIEAVRKLKNNEQKA